MRCSEVGGFFLDVVYVPELKALDETFLYLRQCGFQALQATRDEPGEEPRSPLLAD